MSVTIQSYLKSLYIDIDIQSKSNISKILRYYIRQDLMLSF